MNPFRMLFPAAALVLVLALPFNVRAAEDIDFRLVEEGRYALRAVDAPLGEILDQLKDESGVPLDIDPALLTERVTLTVEGDYEALLKALTGSYALVYKKAKDGSIELISARVTSQGLLDEDLLSRGDRRSIKKQTKLANKTARRIRDIYGFAGSLNYDEAKALVKQREEQFNALVDELAALSPNGARAIKQSFAGTEDFKTKHAMILALQKMDDQEASLVLGSLFADENASHSLKTEIISALGHRGSDPNTANILIGMIHSETDSRRIAKEAMALIGPGLEGSAADRSAVVGTLLHFAGSDAVDRQVQHELINSLGEIGGPEALDALNTLALSGDSVNVKVVARTLGRHLGNAALGPLENLLNHSDPGVVDATVKGINAVKTGAAQQLLQQTAASHPSELAQQTAQRYVGSSAP